METTLCLGNKNRSYWLGENNCKPVSEIGLVLEYIKNSKTSVAKTIRLEVGQRDEQAFHQRGFMDSK